MIDRYVLGAICILVCTSDGACPPSAVTSFPFIMEYAVWRGWHQAILLTPDLEPGCQWTIVRLIKCFGVNGIATSLGFRGTPRIQRKLGLILLAPFLKSASKERLTKVIEKLHNSEMNSMSYDWLVVARSEFNLKGIHEILNVSSIRFDDNVIVSYPRNVTKQSTLGICEGNFVYKTSKTEIRRNERRYDCRFDKDCLKSEYEKNYYRSSERFRDLVNCQTYNRGGLTLPLKLSGVLNYNYSSSFNMVNSSNFLLSKQFHKWRQIGNIDVMRNGSHVVQYFKARKNSTLYASYLGFWSKHLSFTFMESPYPVEARNFLGEVLTVGRSNSTKDGSTSVDDEGQAIGLMDDILYFLSVRLNATSVMQHYSKLGYRTYEGTWTGLLGALMEHSVDLALEPVTAHGHQDMDFLFPIAETMCNIYIREQETSTVRDIFLAPFSARLLMCVVAVALVAALSVVMVSRLTPSKDRSLGVTEALIWSTGILCQQGGNWTPSTPSASVLLIVCLLFAVVTYNAYAAFITSVLSVRVASVDTVAAVLLSPDFNIGYIRNGADQQYLMSTKDAQLNEFYIRGYTDPENLVATAEEGLSRAASQDYAFFADQRTARAILKSLSQARGRCAVRELPIPSTRAQLAFPLLKRSPYAKPTLVSLLLLRSSGALSRLEAALVPAMPQCTAPAGFASARATDVRSALILLLIGLIIAPIIGIGEYWWKNRKKLRVFAVGLLRKVTLLKIF